MVMRERVLAKPPGMLPLFARAGVAMIPAATRLPLLGGGRRAAELPDTALVLEHVEVDRDRLAAYDRVCGFPLRDQLPCTYPHVLAFPLHLELMTDPSFPFAPLGLVHIANRIVQRRRLRANDRLTLRVWAGRLEPHPRGRQFTLRSETRVGSELVWEEDSTILKRGDGDGDAAKRETTDAASELPPVATWRLPGDLGRRYSAVSGDYNPIHIHPLSARLFGFPTAIAHGMWTKARCLAALDSRLPDRFTVEVRFRRPILLPATVQFGERTTGTQEGVLGREGIGARQGVGQEGVVGEEGIEFSVRGAGDGPPHLDGRVTFSTPAAGAFT